MLLNRLNFLYKNIPFSSINYFYAIITVYIVTPNIIDLLLHDNFIFAPTQVLEGK